MLDIKFGNQARGGHNSIELRAGRPLGKKGFGGGKGVTGQRTRAVYRAEKRGGGARGFAWRVRRNVSRATVGLPRRR